MAQDSASILSLGSPEDSRSARACGEGEANASSLPFAEAREVVVQYTFGSSRRVLLFIEALLNMEVLTYGFQLRTHKCQTGNKMSLLTPRLSQVYNHQQPASRMVGMR